MAKLMSERPKYELAPELGVHDIVHREGWGGVCAGNCGRLVRLAIQRAEEALATGGKEERRQALLLLGSTPPAARGIGCTWRSSAPARPR